jgi:transcriptional regulator with XRE-family HTH domain
MSRKRESEPAASLIVFFGTELRRRRNEAGLTIDELGRELHVSGSLISKIEIHDRTPQPDFGRACDAFFGTDGMFARICKSIKEAILSHPAGFPDFLAEEAQAASMEKWASLNVPGLLQTEDYARALFRASRPADTDEEIEQLVASRLERQGILKREKPPRGWFALDEALLRRPVGGPAVMAVQLARIAEVAERPGIIVQVVPTALGAHAGLLGEFTLLTRPDGTRVAYTESISSSQLIERPEDVAEFVLAYDTLRMEALTPRESLDFIRKLQKEYENDAKSG